MTNEAERRHEQKKEQYQREVLKHLRINEIEAQRIINQRTQQAQQEAQQEAQQFTGRLSDFAEVQHRNTTAVGKSKTEGAE